VQSAQSPFVHYEAELPISYIDATQAQSIPWEASASMTAIIKRSGYTISILAVSVFVLEPLVTHRAAVYKDAQDVIAHYVPMMQMVRTLPLYSLYRHIHHFSLYA